MSLRCIAKHCDSRSYPQKLWRVARQVVQENYGQIPRSIKNYITVSDFSEGILKPFLPIHARVFRVNNPVNMGRREPVECDRNSAFVFVGRLSPEKGADLFANAANRLDLAPVFVGDGELRKTIERICPDARITGWLSSDRVEHELMSARALVFPSLWFETQGLAVAEAAALGIPSIVADNCAARSMVEDGRTGLWFRGGDEDDLVGKISHLRQPDVAAGLGRAAYETFWKGAYLPEAHLDQLTRCYDKILHDKL